MTNDYVIVDHVQGIGYVNGELLPVVSNIGLALEKVELSGLIALTGPMLARARSVAPLEDPIWSWANALTGIYNIKDHEGRFGKKGDKVNVISHRRGHPFDNSARVLGALDELFESDEIIPGQATITLDEEKALLVLEEGIQVYDYRQLLELSEDPNFLKKNPNFRVVRTGEVLRNTPLGLQKISELYDNSTVVACTGGRAQARAYLNRAGEKSIKGIFEAWYHCKEGGRLLYFNEGGDGLNGFSDFTSKARFVVREERGR